MEKVFHLSGLHCQGCARIIEAELSEKQGVQHLEIDQVNSILKITFDDLIINESDIKATLNRINYDIEEVTVDTLPLKNNTKTDKKRYFAIVQFLLTWVLIIIVIQLTHSLGWNSITKTFNQDELSLALIFLAGLVAGFHCLGMCGGIVGTLSVCASNQDKSHRTHFLYNLGRVVSYSLSGFLLGLISSLFILSESISAPLQFAANSLMLLFGLSMLGLVRNKKSNPIQLWLAQKISNLKIKIGQKPFLIGLLNVLVPCGPLQALQAFALASGNPFKGMLIMAVYALGTAPILFLAGTSLSRFMRSQGRLIMRVSGIIITILALNAIWQNSYSFLPEDNHTSTSNNQSFQEVKMKVKGGRFDPKTIEIKAGQKVRWVIDATQASGCTNEIILHGYGIQQKLKKGENIIEFTPRQSGTIDFSCWMEMVWGKFVVLD